MPTELIFFSEAFLLAGLSLLMLYWRKEALIAFFVLQLICANLFVLHLINLFGWTVTSTDVFTIGTLFTLTCLQERYGKSVARGAIWIGVAMVGIFGLVSLFHGHTLSTPRIFFSSIAACFLADRLDLFLYRSFKMRIALRFALATLISQFIDTALFTALALTGRDLNLKDIFVFSFIVKIAAIFSMSLVAPLIRRVQPRAV